MTVHYNNITTNVLLHHQCIVCYIESIFLNEKEMPLCVQFMLSQNTKNSTLEISTTLDLKLFLAGKKETNTSTKSQSIQRKQKCLSCN